MTEAISAALARQSNLFLKERLIAKARELARSGITLSEQETREWLLNKIGCGVPEFVMNDVLGDLGFV